MLQLTPSMLIQVVVTKTEHAPDRANVDKRSVVKFGGCARQLDKRAPDWTNIDKRSMVKFGGCASQVD